MSHPLSGENPPDSNDPTRSPLANDGAAAPRSQEEDDIHAAPVGRASAGSSQVTGKRTGSGSSDPIVDFTPGSSDERIDRPVVDDADKAQTEEIESQSFPGGALLAEGMSPNRVPHDPDTFVLDERKSELAQGMANEETPSGIIFAQPSAARSQPMTSAAAAPPPPARPLLHVALFTWASLATLIAIWLWLQRERHFLENLPDDGVLLNQIVDPFEDLSSRQLVRLGESKTFGQIEVTPLAIASRPVKIVPDDFETSSVLVLTMRIKNISADQPIRPLDPVFLYFHAKRRKLDGRPAFNETGYTYSFIHPAGGVEKIILPYDLIYSQDYAVEGQTFPLLAPGDATEAMIVSEEDAESRLSEDMVWRVKLRKRKTAAGKGIATVVGVVFKKDDVNRRPAASPSS